MSRSSKGPSLVVLACLFGAGMVAPVAAQTALCPASPVLSNGVQVSDVTLQKGLCTNAGTPSARAPAIAGGFPTGAFSGAALASQALSQLTQATTLETTRSLQDGMSKRRDDERQLCSAGFTLVGGSCETGRSAAVRTMPENVAPAARSGDRAPRLSSWIALYGDHERRSAGGREHFTVGAWGGGTMPLDLPVSVRTRAESVGFTFGADATVRGLIAPDDGVIAGLSLGYLAGDVTVTTASGPSRDLAFPPALGQGTSVLHAALRGLSTGAYVVYFNGAFSADLLLKADLLTLDETFNDVFSFTHPGEGQPPLTSSFAGTGRFGLIDTTLAGSLEYRLDLDPSFWLEPTVGAQYTHSAYGRGAVDFGLDDADLVRLQGGARVGIPVMIAPRTLMTTTLTGLAYSDLLVTGGFVPGAAFLAANLLADADRGQVRGRGVVAINVDSGNGLSSFLQGEVRGGEGLFGAGGRAGIRILW